METIITIKKNKPAYRALILLAKEFEKNDNISISIKEENKQKERSRSTEIKNFLAKYNLNLQNFSFNRDEIYKR